MLMVRFSEGASFVASIALTTKLSDDLLELDVIAGDWECDRGGETAQFDFSSSGYR